MRILLTLITLVCLSGTSWSQQNNKPNVWVVNDMQSGFDVFYKPFMKALKTLRIGNRLKEVASFDEPNRIGKPGDLWIVVFARTNTLGGWQYNIIWGRYDLCGNPSYETFRTGYWTQGQVDYGELYGYDTGIDFVEWILGRDGVR